MQTVSENKCFGGVQGVYQHRSAACDCDMTFGLFLPQEAADGPVPLLWYLSGLTCTHENAMTKAGAQVWAAEHGIALCFPDTSPRGAGVADDDAYDLGQGAGFYINATETPWAAHFKMWDYITEELPNVLTSNFAIDADRQSITGHSMGGHGALTVGLTLGERFRSVSALSPICNPTQTEWGQKQFQSYLGSVEAGRAHDATLLMRERRFDGPMLVDVGTDDNFWDYLSIPAFAEAMSASRQSGQIRLRDGYDHSYFFISSVIEDHIAFHAEALWA